MVSHRSCCSLFPYGADPSHNAYLNLSTPSPILFLHSWAKQFSLSHFSHSTFQLCWTKEETHKCAGGEGLQLALSGIACCSRRIPQSWSCFVFCLILENPLNFRVLQVDFTEITGMRHGERRHLLFGNGSLSMCKTSVALIDLKPASELVNANLEAQPWTGAWFCFTSDTTKLGTCIKWNLATLLLHVKNVTNEALSLCRVTKQHTNVRAGTLKCTTALVLPTPFAKLGSQTEKL